MASVSDASARRLQFVVVGIGASAGGLEAVSALLDVLPAKSGMAFVLVQHLDPTHDSLLVEILSRRTKLKVMEARDGLRVAGDHLYIIPPGAYLSLSAGTLRLSEPTERHGTRLPFDYTLHSLAEAYGPNAVCVILSGNGVDGSLGLKSVVDKGGMVIAQDPNEAGYAGMPQSAIATGRVDLILPVAQIAEALVKYQVQMAETDAPQYIAAAKNPPECLPQIVELLREKTAQDYSLYKPGTLLRRIERRMTLASMKPDNMMGYLDRLRVDDGEAVQLAKDLLIHVTGFFRDPAAFKLLADKIIPDLIKAHPRDMPIRVWSVGCSTGEEAYSLAMLFREALSAAGRDNRLQIFASDADPDAIATARNGLYSTEVEADISPVRLKQYFSREADGYRVLPQLRLCVVFTVQDVLTDPPFSRLDFVSCRNLLIYLGPEAQARAISLFHFALRQGGLLLLGASETPGSVGGRFEVVSKAERIFRQVGRSRPGDFGFSRNAWTGIRTQEINEPAAAAPNRPTVADFCRQWTIETSAPATVLVNANHDCLFKLGPVSRFLTVPEGDPTTNILAMAPSGLQSALRACLMLAGRSPLADPAKEPPAGPNSAPVTMSASYVNAQGDRLAVNIEVRTCLREGEPLFLVNFVERRHSVDASSRRDKGAPDLSDDDSRIRALEIELERTYTELEALARTFEIAGEEQKAINEEASSVNEEYQSANEELLTSKEELQSLNEELTALNSQLQETLDRQRTTANDLQNVLYSTNVATLFLDLDLNIRFFTPTTRSLFNIIATDIGRPLSDLHSLASDTALASDAREVLRHRAPVERAIETSQGLWFLRRVMPYLSDESSVDGVVITFTDITERNRIARDLQAAKQAADLANIAKTRFLAAASHDLRQPLQSLALIQGLLAKAVVGEKAEQLVVRLDDTIETMSGMLNTLLDINQFESGMMRANKINVPVNEIFDRLRHEFLYHAQARGLTFEVVRTSLIVVSDPVLLEQLIRNLLSNAMKYTPAGGVVLGCRRHKHCVKIEVWDSGIGISETDQETIFEEYYQVNNAARERSRGLGLGLSIVKRLGDVLDHQISVHSQPGKGSVFTIEVRRLEVARTGGKADGSGATDRPARVKTLTGTILVIEDDPEVRGLLQILLETDGHRVAAVGDGPAALLLLRQAGLVPDLIVADYNLPNGMTGVEVAAQCTTILNHKVPVIILTGDVSTATHDAIEVSNAVQMNKPVTPRTLSQAIQSLLATSRSVPVGSVSGSASGGVPALIYVVDDDRAIRDGVKSILDDEGFSVSCFASAEAFLASYEPDRQASIVIDAGLPGMSGLELLKTLRAGGHHLPALMITGSSDVAMAVEAMKAGATDFLEKPVRPADLIRGVRRALAQSMDIRSRHGWQASAARHLSDLTARQRQIMHMVLAGHPSKNIATDLKISQRTVENHRAAIMAKTGAKSLPALARIVMDAGDPI